MSKYQELMQNPPKVYQEVKKNAKEVIFYVVSCMCDNKYKFRFKKNDEGDFKLTCYGFAFSNFGIKDDKYELEWAADEGDFFDVVQMINSGYQLVEKVVSR